MNHDQIKTAIDSKVADILRSKLAEVTADRDHWKANHDNRVNAAKILMDRTDMPLERVGAYKQYVAALEENQKLRERAEKAEAELAKLREHKPALYMAFSECGQFIRYWTRDKSKLDATMAVNDFLVLEFYAAPVAAPAVPAPDDIHELAYELGGTDSGEYHLEPEALDRIIAAAQAMVDVPDDMILMPREADERLVAGFVGCETREEAILGWQVAVRMQEVSTGKRQPVAPVELVDAGGCAPAIVTTPFIPDADTRRNDEAFAAQQAATAPSVPAEWLCFLQEMTLQPEHGPNKCICFHCENIRRARVLLQSAEGCSSQAHNEVHHD